MFFQMVPLLMSKLAWNKLFLFLIVLLPSVSNAQVIISEIMYDLSGTDSNEWVEVQNTSAQSIDLSTWKFFEGNSNHGLTAYQGDPNIPANGFAIIAHDPVAFKSEFTSFTGVIFDSSFSLNNTTGETLVIRDGALSDIDSVAYTPDQGGNGDGNSLQKILNDWEASIPTPGVANGAKPDATQENTQSDSQNSQTNSSTVSTYTSSATESNASTKQTFSLSIGKDRLVAVSNPVRFEADVKNADGYSGRSAAFMWTLGDGSMKSGQSVEYNYRYPGDYIVVLNASRAGEDVVARVHVKVVEPNIHAIANTDGSVKMENHAKEDMNLSGWQIEFLGKAFLFPQDTIVKGGSSITIPSEIVGFVTNSLIPIQIRNPLGLLYIPKSSIQQETPSLTTNLPKQSTATPVPPPEEPIQEIDSTEVSTSTVSSTASDLESPKVVDSIEASSNKNIAAVGSVITIEKPKGFWRSIKDFFARIF